MKYPVLKIKTIVLGSLFCLLSGIVYSQNPDRQTNPPGTKQHLQSPTSTSRPAANTANAPQLHAIASNYPGLRTKVPASEIRVLVNQATDKKISITEPVNGAFFWTHRKKLFLDDSNKATIRLHLNKSGPVTLLASGVNLRLFVQPGEKITIEIHPDDSTKEFLVSGKNAEGQVLLNDKKGYYLFKSDEYLKKYTPTASALEKVGLDLEGEIQSYKDLFDQQKIDQPFLDYATLNSRYYYAAIMASIVRSKYQATLIYPKDSPNYSPSFQQVDADAWEKIYADYPVENTRAMSTFTYYDYLADYIRTYAGVYLAKKRDTYKEFNNTNYYSGTYSLFVHSLKKEAVREYGLAGFIQLESIQDDYNPKLLALYKRFSRQFSQNPYSVYLKPMMSPILAFTNKEKAGFKADQKIFARYDTVNSLDELLQSFRGKTVFVDIWATWCGPCKAEFEHSASLRQFLKANGVEMLYISMDNEKADTYWKTMVKYYNLAGTHVRTNVALQNDLIKRLWGGPSYTIPRYLIIDKSGAIAEKDALRPSDKEKLYDQVKGYL